MPTEFNGRILKPVTIMEGGQVNWDVDALGAIHLLEALMVEGDMPPEAATALAKRITGMAFACMQQEISDASKG